MHDLPGEYGRVEDMILKTTIYDLRPAQGAEMNGWIRYEGNLGWV